jgi:hypothetical protein
MTVTRDDDLAAAAAAAEWLPDPREIVATDEEVPLEVVFDDAFVREHTDFETFDEMVAASPSDADSAADLGRVPEGAWDEFVAATTEFDDEEALLFAAIDDWVAEQLGL